MGLHLAIDLGAGSGRAILGRLEGDALQIEEVHRFHYEPVRSAGHLRWPFAKLIAGIEDGLSAAAAVAKAGRDAVVTVGVDSWGVDYGLLDSSGRRIEDPVCYRDERTEGVMEEVFETMPRADLFARTGLQFLPLNTLFQLVAHVREGLPPQAHRMLMVPDLCHHHLCGSIVAEYTDASTTQLLSVATRRWDDVLCERLELPQELLPEIVEPGTELGLLRADLVEKTGLAGVRVLAPATHDTASAVVGAPLQPGWAYISSGTWSLVGVEISEPLATPGVALANFTNEGGPAGTIRFLKNVMGLWILEQCRKEWAAAGTAVDHAVLVGEASRIPEPVAFVFPDDPRFFNPKSMVAEIRGFLLESGQACPDDPIQLTRVVLDSLALRCATVVSTAERLTGIAVPGIHIVGGGCRNEYLNQATADASGRPVMAGPAEATATGNVLVQAMATGSVASIAEGRRLVARTVRPARYAPRGTDAWGRAAERYLEIERRFLG